jgi:hypothetical protein
MILAYVFKYCSELNSLVFLFAGGSLERHDYTEATMCNMLHALLPHVEQCCLMHATYLQHAPEKWLWHIVARLPK